MYIQHHTLLFRDHRLLGTTSGTGTSTHQRRRNKVKRRKAYYNRQRRTDVTVNTPDLLVVSSTAKYQTYICVVIMLV